MGPGIRTSVTAPHPERGKTLGEGEPVVEKCVDGDGEQHRPEYRRRGYLHPGPDGLSHGQQPEVLGEGGVAVVGARVPSH